MRRMLLTATLLLGACAGAPMPPDWQMQSHAALEKFRRQYLEGDTAGAQRSFAQAKAAVAATGKPELVARVELYRCALGVASLDLDACHDYDSVRSDATVEDRAYAGFLEGKAAKQDISRLPAQYAQVAAAVDAASGDAGLSKIDDPVSRLVAAGALFRGSRISTNGVATAVESASAQGYRRPLLAWLNVQAKQAQAAGDSAALASIQRRIDVVFRSLPATKP